MAITGANLNPKVNGDPIPMWQSFYIEKGDTLTFRKHLSGVRAYIAISGGYDVPYIFGSQSTDMQSGFGKQLEKSTFVKGFLTDDPVLKEVGLEKSSVPIYREHVSVSIIEGPHTHTFTKEGYSLFYNQTYIVDTASNRMGYRLF